MNTILSLLILFLSACVAAKECAQLDITEVIKEKRLVILGELHGTKEAPAFAGTLVCNLSKGNKKIAFAIEMPASTQAQLQGALLQNQKISASKEFDALSFWNSPFQDGKRSHAYKDLLMTLWDLRAANENIKLIAIDIDESPNNTGNAREQYMASRLSSFLQEFPDYAVVALVGNLHARKLQGTPWNKTYTPMAFLLRDIKFITLDIGYIAGSAWNCMGTECLERPVSRLKPTGVVKLPIIKLSELDANFDGEYDLNEVTASPPLKIFSKNKIEP